jgi:hypothetical protein
LSSIGVCFKCALITKSSTGKEVLDILFLGDIESIEGRRHISPKEIAKKTKFSHEKLLTETNLKNTTDNTVEGVKLALNRINLGIELINSRAC